MRLLKETTVNLIIGLNVFLAFLLLFGPGIDLPLPLKVVGRMHPLLLHFPIVLLLTAFVFEAFKKHFPLDRADMGKIIQTLLLAGCLSAAVTAVLGLFLSSEEGYSGDTLQWHKWTGTAVSFLSPLLWWGYTLRKGRNILYAGMVVVLGLLLVAGHFGASLTHGENYVLAPMGSTGKTTVDLSEAHVYSDLVQPILKEKCFSCHNPDKAKGELVMTDTSSFSAGGKSGKPFAAATFGESLLVERLLLDIDHEHRMPPKGKPQLSQTEIALVKAWINGGGDFTVRLADAPDPEIKPLASALYGSSAENTYDFGPANAARIEQLNTSYRLVAPVAFNTPALDVSFFNRNSFELKSLEEIKEIATQVVQLNLSGMPVGDAEMAVVASFPNLRRLNLNYTGVTDQGLAAATQLPALRTLMITGTEVTTAGLTSLLNASKLSQVYAWNTLLGPQEADSLMQIHPGLRIDSGFMADDTTTLQLNNPRLNPEHIFFRQPFALTVDHPVAGTDLLYTTDGSEPDSLQSPRFRESITISDNTVVKVKAVKEGWIQSPVVEKSYQRTTYLPDTFSLAHPPHPLHKGRGAATLFDLAEGSTDILYASDGKWLGYNGQEFIAELGFKQPVVLKEILLSTLLSARLESFPPYEVEIWGHGPGNPPERMARLKPEMPAKDSKVRRNIISCPIAGHKPVSTIKIIARPVEKLPAWHPNPGKPAWLFIDEILLN